MAEDVPRPRGFLRTAMWSSIALILLESAAAGLALFWPRKVEGFGSVIAAGKIDDFPVPSVTRFRDGKMFERDKTSPDRPRGRWISCASK